jgi:hypothetical protein
MDEELFTEDGLISADFTGGTDGGRGAFEEDGTGGGFCRGCGDLVTAVDELTHPIMTTDRITNHE